MLSPALETQYSARLTLAKVLETEVMKTIWGSRTVPAATSSIIARATAWVRKNGPRRLIPRTRSQLSGVVSSRSSRAVGGDAGVVDPDVDPAEGGRGPASSRRLPCVEVGDVGPDREGRGSASGLGLAAASRRPPRSER